MPPRRLTSRDARRRARGTRDLQWAFMERVARAGLLWFCNWNQHRMPEGKDEYRVCLITGQEIFSWVEAHSDWFVVGDWSKERYAFPVELTDAGRSALADRSPWDMEDVHGGLVEPGFVCRPAATRTRCYRRDALGEMRRVVLAGGVEGFHVAFTRSCSGCFEAGENGGREGLYPYDEKAGCRIGLGCSECGGSGKRRRVQWVPFDQRELDARVSAELQVARGTA